VNKLQQAPMAEIESAMYPSDLTASMDDVGGPVLPADPPPPTSSAVPQVLADTPETTVRT
jgi:hypothetical protein